MTAPCRVHLLSPQEIKLVNRSALSIEGLSAHFFRIERSKLLER